MRGKAAQVLGREDGDGPPGPTHIWRGSTLWEVCGATVAERQSVMGEETMAQGVLGDFRRLGIPSRPKVL